MKKSLKELELATPVINIIDTRKIVGGYDGDQRPPGWDWEFGIIDFPPPQPEQPEQPDEFTPPDNPPILGDDFEIDWGDPEIDDPGLDPINPGGDDSDGGRGEGDEEDSDRPDNPNDDLDRPEDQEDERDDGQNDGFPSNDSGDQSDPDNHVGLPSFIFGDGIDAADRDALRKALRGVGSAIMDNVRDYIIIVVNPSLGHPAQYDHKTGIISVRDPGDTPSSALAEELVHSLQDDYYKQAGGLGLAGLTGAGRSNVEFEAHVAKDIAEGYKSGWLGASMTVGFEDSDDYIMWLNDITNGFEQGSGIDANGFESRYDEFFDKFREFWENEPGYSNYPADGEWDKDFILDLFGRR